MVPPLLLWRSMKRGKPTPLNGRWEICQRAYQLLTEQVGFPPEDIIFDPNIFAVATGIEEHNAYAKAFIDACREIKATCPHALVSGGVSNISFAFRGNDTVREAMHRCVSLPRYQCRYEYGYR